MGLRTSLQMPTAELPRSRVWASERQGPELPLQEAGRLLANARKEVQWRGRDQDLGQAVKTRQSGVCAGKWAGAGHVGQLLLTGSGQHVCYEPNCCTPKFTC